MNRSKILISSLLAIVFLAAQVVAVGASPAAQEGTPITGNVDSIVLETNPDTGETSVVVTLTDDLGVTQTVRLSVETAATLGLVTTDETGATIVNEAAINTKIEIDPSDVIVEEEEGGEEEQQHPVGSALSDFFSELLGVDYETVMDYHDDGVGFGVIAQALWMTNALEGDSETFAAILEAKKTKDYSTITLPDGSTPQNWGQFRKAVMSDRDKSKENLGAIMSGHAGDQTDDTQMGPGTNNVPGNGNGNNGSGNNGNGNNGNGNGNNKDKNKNKNKNK